MIKQFIKKIVPKFLLDWYYQFFPFLGALIYRFPSRKLSVIGITGTNGKSTVVELVSSILNQAGCKVASASSIRFQIRDKVWQNKLKMTMPGRMKLQAFLKKAVDRGCDYAVIEVTSEGIKQFRHAFIDFKTAVITNLTREHIESHGSFENYKKEKAKLFKKAKVVIVNLDDKNADYFLNLKEGKKYGFTIQGEERPGIEVIKGEEITLFRSGSQFKVLGEKLKINLPGKFNVSNALAAVCVGLSQKVALEDIKKGLEEVKNIPGRLDIVSFDPFSVYVDYAHTPDALENIYKTLKTDKNLICVLGSCGGGRDKWKRPELGRIAENYCDKIILTNEDPYDEDPQTILEDIKKGIVKKEAEMILDRKEAIRKALTLALPGDTVIITGKGREPWMCLANGRRIPWDDKEIVEEQLDL